MTQAQIEDLNRLKQQRLIIPEEFDGKRVELISWH